GTPAALIEFETTRLDLSRRMLEISDEIASFAWTDSDVQSLHRAFSAEMSREVRTLAALEPSVSHPAATASDVALLASSWLRRSSVALAKEDGSRDKHV